MKVLHVIPSVAARTGGPAVLLRELVGPLAALGVESTIFTTDLAAPASAGDRTSEAPAGAEVFRASFPRRLAFSPPLYRKLGRVVPDYDVVHVHSLFLFPQFAAYRQARRHGAPYVVSPHGALDPYLRRRGGLRKRIADRLWQRAMLERAAALHVTAEPEAELIADIAPDVPRFVAPAGIRWSELASPPRNGFRERHLDGYEGPVVMNVGRISFKKGLDVLVSAFALVVRDVPDVRLVLVGPDDEGLGSGLRALGSELGVEDKVRFTGMLTGGDKLAALGAATVWVLPSHTENFGLAVAEALAAGVPTVISPAVNLARELAAAEAAVVCEQEPEPIARELVELLRDPDRRLVLAERGREFARRFDWDEVAPRWAEMYASVVARG